MRSDGTPDLAYLSEARVLSMFAGAVLALATVAALPLAAQQSGNGAAAPVCFHPRPISTCRSFVVAELSLMAGVVSSSESITLDETVPETFRALGSHLSWQLGWLWNVSSRTAVGVSGLAGYGGPAGRRGVRLASRYWIDPERSIGVSAGPLWATVGGLSQRDGRGVSADVRYTWQDRFAATIRIERLATERKFPEPAGFHEFPHATALYAGVTLGTGAAFAGTAALAGLGIAWLLLYALSGSGPSS